MQHACASCHSSRRSIRPLRTYKSEPRPLSLSLSLSLSCSLSLSLSYEKCKIPTHKIQPEALCTSRPRTSSLQGYSPRRFLYPPLPSGFMEPRRLQYRSYGSLNPVPLRSPTPLCHFHL
jgi:hypothetical protein